MPRVARLVVPNRPHHVIQRTNRAQPVFLNADDYRFYLELAVEWTRKCEVEIWGYCLLPDHVHFIAVPGDKDALRAAFSQIHKRYAHMLNQREEKRGHVWQSRFSSYAMDESYMLTALLYIEMAPVKAGLVSAPPDYQWSSAAAHAGRCDDTLLEAEPLASLIKNWDDFWNIKTSAALEKMLKKHASSGKPAGSAAFVKKVAAIAT